MFDFPAAPVIGQVYAPLPGVNYTFDGVAWVYSIGATPLSISALLPAFMVSGGRDALMRIQGVGFQTTSVIHLNGAPVATIFASNEELQCTMLASLETGARSVVVSVRNAAVESNALAFNYTAVPVLTGTNPTSISQGGGSIPVAFIGTNFLPESKCYCNGTELATAFVSTTELTATMITTLGTPGDSLFMWVQTGRLISSNQILFGIAA